METKRMSIKAAFIVGISFFLGFSSIFLLRFMHPGYGMLVLLDLLYFITSGQVLIGLGLSFLIGLITYLTFNFMIKRGIFRKNLGWTTLFISIIAIIIGFFTFLPTHIFVMEKDFGKECLVGQSDTNNDGRIDKWVYSSVYNKIRIDYDTNFDNMPDIKEYYKKGELIKKEIDADFDGRPDKIEEYK